MTCSSEVAPNIPGDGEGLRNRINGSPSGTIDLLLPCPKCCLVGDGESPKADEKAGGANGEVEGADARGGERARRAFVTAASRSLSSSKNAGVSGSSYFEGSGGGTMMVCGGAGALNGSSISSCIVGIDGGCEIARGEVGA